MRLRDVARIEIGGQSYQFNTRLNGKPTAGLSVLLSPTGNALATASAVEAKMKELSRFFPANIAYDIPYNITPFVKASIEKVLSTLVEAVVLVFIVMFLFLQNIRYTIIPTIVVPVALLGTCATLLLAGFSINMLTMFGMVLAVGILVDDAIVVVENVERIMAEEGLPPKEATRKAMSQITGAIIGITLVLIAVFVPMAFFPGSVGIIYRQFSVTMVAAIALLRAAGAVADAGAVRDAAQAGRRPATAMPARACSAGSTACSTAAATGYSRTVQAVAEAHRPADADLCGAAGRAGLGLRAPARRLPAGRRPGLHHHRRADAVGSSYARTEAAVEKVEKYLAQRAGRRERHLPHRLQLPRPGHEHRAGLHHAEGLVGARAEGFRGRDRRRHQPRSRPRSATPRSPRCSRRRSTISATPPASASACRTAARRAMPALIARGRPADRGGQCRARSCRRSMSRACRRRRRSI